MEKHAREKHGIEEMAPVSVWNKFPEQHDEIRRIAVECYSEEWAAKMIEALEISGFSKMNGISGIADEGEIQLMPEIQTEDEEIDSKEGKISNILPN